MSDEDEYVVMCALAKSSRFEDDLYGPCDGGCGATLCWRPHNPPEALHLCALCCIKKAITEDGDVEFRVTPKTVQEALDYFEAEADKLRGKPS